MSVCLAKFVTDCYLLCLAKRLLSFHRPYQSWVESYLPVSDALSVMFGKLQMRVELLVPMDLDTLYTVIAINYFTARTQKKEVKQLVA